MRWKQGLTAVIREVLAVFFAGFNAQFQSLCHFVDPSFCVSINIFWRAAMRGVSAGILMREECPSRREGQGKIPVEAVLEPRLTPAARDVLSDRNTYEGSEMVCLL
ncbi:hypothetical protein [Aliiroseovarius sp. 2305UL8-7]|uniref:hypothetical protein n=1 Tax=Aliiroseovarius conchicola TaxID=3121637 RepID=UPI003529D171